MRFANSVSLRLMAWAMAFCPSALALLFHTGIKSEPLSIQIPKPPALVFNQYSVDLREIQLTRYVEGTYIFMNRGAEPVRITKLEPSCDCLTAHLQGARDNVIEPGSQGRIVLQMQPGHATPGRHDYTLTVKYTDPEPQEVRLLLRMQIPAILWVSPPWLSVFQPRGAEALAHEFKVTDGRGKRFEVTDVSVDTDLVTVAIGESGFGARGIFLQSIHVLIAGDLPPGRTQYTMRITTTDDEFPELRVPILLEGPAEKDANLDHEQSEHTDNQEDVTSETVPVRRSSAQE